MFLFYVNPILIAAAVIPAIVLLRFVYKEDRLDKESPGLLLSLMVFGILATFAAIVTEQIGEAILGVLLPRNSTAYNVLLYFVVVALSEEGFKYLLLRKRTWWSGEFNCQFDGVVYAVFVSLGFALWENISYVLMYGLGTALVRAITAVPGHACFGAFMGAFYGLAKRYDNFGDEYRSRRCRRCGRLVRIAQDKRGLTHELIHVERLGQVGRAAAVEPVQIDPCARKHQHTGDQHVPFP